MPDFSVPVRDAPPAVRFVDRRGARTFARPTRILSTARIEEVVPLLADVEREAGAGRIAAGFVAYEAAAAFDPALATHCLAGPLPLAWFAVYEGPGREESPHWVSPDDSALPVWNSEASAASYRESVGRIRELIAAGDTYQVNFTFPMRAPFDGDAEALFKALVAAQPTDHGCLIDTDTFAVLSVSPELFFRLEGDSIVCRPMKGTAARGLWFDDDQARGHALRASAKERAENVMIVDMVRNDLGRIAETGSVAVASLFDTERLETCWQMTSAVHARTRAGLPDIFRALFPCASVTGAPKVRTMQIIRELERAPRGVYCGAIGRVGPGRRAEFSVGIRTVTVDRAAREAIYHVGSGITWDSALAAEFDECVLKAAVLTHRRPAFDLLESLRWDGDYWLLDGHMERLRASAEYFGFAFDESRVRTALDAFARTLRAPAKVRVTLSCAGRTSIDSSPLRSSHVWRVALSQEPVDESDVFLYHKTTHRNVYESANALFPGADDVILWNPRGELTESTRANLALRFDDCWFTPPVSCGLLGGVFRAQLLREGALAERVMSIGDLDSADEVRLINSVRGWIEIERIRQPQALAGRS